MAGSPINALCFARIDLVVLDVVDDGLASGLDVEHERRAIGRV
jgi:hypothetical protein